MPGIIKIPVQAVPVRALLPGPLMLPIILLVTDKYALREKYVQLEIVPQHVLI